MKSKFTLAFLIIFSLQLSAQSLHTFYDFSWPTIMGDTVSMARYAGKKILVVNTASYCAYTYEYGPLDKLDSIYSRFNFAVVGFPCNDFGNQGGTDSAIIATCSHYDVNFQIMSTVKIVTGDTAPLWKWLQRSDLNGVANHHVTWNFNKFLIDRQGHLVQWYDSPTSPLDAAITDWIVADSASIHAGITSTSADDNTIRLKSTNPISDVLTLQINRTYEDLNINLYTIDGRLIADINKGQAALNNEIRYSTSSIPSGIYLLRANNSEMDRTIKCVIQH